MVEFASRRAAKPSGSGCGRAGPGRLVRAGSLQLPWRPWQNSLPVVGCLARCIIQACGQRRQVLLEREGLHSAEFAVPTIKTKQKLSVTWSWWIYLFMYLTLNVVMFFVLFPIQLISFLLSNVRIWSCQRVNTASLACIAVVGKK